MSAKSTTDDGIDGVLEEIELLSIQEAVKNSSPLGYFDEWVEIDRLEEVPDGARV